jgi:uncharacterized nucleotidyltransferase DUF6036
VTAEERFTAALRSVMAALDELAAPSMIIGGVAVIAAGVPRQTIDIDATILGQGATLEDVTGAFERHDIVPRIEDALAFARDHNVLLLVHRPTGVTVEVSFAWLPFEEEALSRSRAIAIEDLELRVARPEDLIVYKATAWRDRDRSDIERLLVLHFDDVDLKRVRGLVAEIGAALDDPERIHQFDDIVARAREER